MSFFCFELDRISNNKLNNNYVAHDTEDFSLFLKNLKILLQIMQIKLLVILHAKKKLFYHYFFQYTIVMYFVLIYF